jgi:hypothetical protein
VKFRPAKVGLKGLRAGFADGGLRVCEGDLRKGSFGVVEGDFWNDWSCGSRGDEGRRYGRGEVVAGGFQGAAAAALGAPDVLEDSYAGPE